MSKKDKKIKKELALKPLFILSFIAILLLILYVRMMLYYCEGELSLPLDDPFIFFQYARQAKEGHPFQYNTGDAPTTGVTSLLYTLLLIPGFLLGFDDLSIIYYSLFLGLVLLISTSFVIYLIGKRLLLSSVGFVASLFFILNGPLVWSFFSGMDTGLFAAMTIFTIYSFIISKEKNSYWALAIFGSLMSLSRPEGFIFSLCLFFLVFINQLIAFRNERLSLLQLFLTFIPVLSGLTQLLLNLILTGSINFNTMVAKSALTRGDSTFLDAMATTIRYSFFLLKEIFAGFAGDYIPVLNANSGYVAVYIAPFALFFFLIAVFPRVVLEIQTKRIGIYSIILFWFFVGILTTSATRPANDHWHRYVIPYYPMFLIMVTFGIYEISRIFSQNQKETFLGISSFFVFFSFLTVLYFAVAYGKNCKDIHLQQISLGKWVRENIPPDAAIAINDAGAIKYIGKRYCIDLVGLCYPEIVRSSTHCGDGNGLIYEFLENLKRKPDYFIIYPSWFGFGSWVLGEEIASFGLFEPTMAGAGSDPMRVYKANFRGANTGDNICLEETKKMLSGKMLVDKIDVAFVKDEKAHSYKTWSAEPGLPKRTFVTTASYNDEPGKIVSDGGRVISGGEEFTINTIPGKPLVIVTRCTSPFSLGVYINGQARAWWRNQKGSQETSLWYEPHITIPAEYITQKKTRVKIEVVDKHRVSYFITHYWFYQ